MQHNHPRDRITGKPIYYVASKSGGHIIPCLTLAQEIRRHHPYVQQTFISSSSPSDTDIIHRSQVIDHLVALDMPAAPKTWYAYPRFILRIGKIIAQFFWRFLRQRPNYIVCTGGMIALPITIAARLLCIRVHWYELNVQPGKATSFITRWFKVRLYTCFTQTTTYLNQYPSTRIEYPVRFFNQRQRGQKEALTLLKLGTERKTICVIGGSQGSTFINQAVLTMLKRHPELYPHIQIIHQAGLDQLEECTRFYIQHRLPVTVCAFNSSIELFYAAADIIICRSGAGTLFEILFFGKPCITIPLESSVNDHQVANATHMQQQYGELFTMLRQDALIADPERLYHAIMERMPINPIPPVVHEDPTMTAVY